MIIIIDTREQLPYVFEEAGYPIVHKALPSGDYSIEGFETQLAVERKRTEEMFCVCGKDRKRFECELERLISYTYAAIVLEGRISDILNPSAFSKVRPASIINSLLSWSVKYGIHVYFAESRRFAEVLTLRILEKFWKHYGPGKDRSKQPKHSEQQQIRGVQSRNPVKNL